MENRRFALLTVIFAAGSAGAPESISFAEAAMPMETIPAESIPVVMGEEDDDRWRAESTRSKLADC